MNDILHLQTRAYPLHYGRLDRSIRVVSVPGRGEVRLATGSLGSQAYNPEYTVEADLTELTRAAVTVPGTEIVSCRARLLAAGTVLLTYALRHDLDLRSMDTFGVADFDARINRELRKADAAALGQVLDAAVTAGLVEDLIIIGPDGITNSLPSTVDPRAVRYNCHFVTHDPPWEPDARVPELVLGPGCRILLPYTYAWDIDPSARLDELLTALEPADLAVAQMSVLFSAMIGGRRILAELAQGALGSIRADDFRRFLDRVWSEYHSFDFYRLESGQDHRATYLAARVTVALDQTHERAGDLLGYVATSLLSESTLRSQQLDTRLNRVAAALTVVAGGSFAIDVAAFLLPDVELGVRLSVVTAVVGLAAFGLGAIIFSVVAAGSGAPRRQRRRWVRPRLPTPRAAPESGVAGEVHIDPPDSGHLTAGSAPLRPLPADDEVQQ